MKAKEMKFIDELKANAIKIIQASEKPNLEDLEFFLYASSPYEIAAARVMEFADEISAVDYAAFHPSDIYSIAQSVAENNPAAIRTALAIKLNRTGWTAEQLVLEHESYLYQIYGSYLDLAQLLEEYGK